MSSKRVETEKRGRVGLVRLNHPETLNAVSVEMVEQLSSALNALEKSSRAILLTGAGRAFSSGGNLSADMAAGGGDTDLGLSLETHVNPLMCQLRDLSIPWMTAVRGAAAGVGCSIALAGDLIVASESAYFMQAFSRIGLVPDGGSSHLLVRTVGRARAMEMMLLGERLPAARALEWGLVNHVVPDDALEADAMALAERLANGPSSLAQTRRMVWKALDSDWDSMLAMERKEQLAAGRSADCAEGIAAFLEKRPARFTGA
ncbi:MAG TPA: enoyl-CoA hydratase-related protein [Allosphingosinicella sp.]|nr:enoyl-CoA hydratase-related protein [Allosphingosinicella sp.]